MQGSGLVYDILILERHLPQTIDFVDEHPKQIFVVDHVAKPLIVAGRLSRGRRICASWRGGSMSSAKYPAW